MITARADKIEYYKKSPPDFRLDTYDPKQMSATGAGNCLSFVALMAATTPSSETGFDIASFTTSWDRDGLHGHVGWRQEPDTLRFADFSALYPESLWETDRVAGCVADGSFTLSDRLMERVDTHKPGSTAFIDTVINDSDQLTVGSRDMRMPEGILVLSDMLPALIEQIGSVRDELGDRYYGRAFQIVRTTHETMGHILSGARDIG